MISDLLIPMLKTQYAGREISFGSSPDPIAIFPASQAAVGRVLVHDEGDEATVYIEKITHGHFGSYDDNLNQDEKYKAIAEDVVEFLGALFSDGVLLYTSGGNLMGGWKRLDAKKGPIHRMPLFRYYLWSKPYEA